MDRRGYNQELNVNIWNETLYKGISRKHWPISSSDSEEKLLEDILAMEVGEKEVELPDIKDKIKEIKEPLRKLILKQKDIFFHQEAKGETSATIIKFMECHLRALLPLDLLGGKKNKLRLISTIAKVLKFGKYDVLTLKFFMFGLRTKKVKWMKNLKDQIVKQNIMAKLVLWIWNMAKKMIASKYYVSETQNTYNQLVFIPKRVWQSKTDKAFNMLVHHQVLEPLTTLEAEEKARTRPEAMLRWLPKGKGLRPVISVRGDKLQKDTINAKAFLKQLLLRTYTNMNVTRLYQIWTEIYERNRSQGFPKLFFVAADLHDAYGSINQDKLISIVKEETQLYLGDIQQVHIDKVFINEKRSLVCRELYVWEKYSSDAITTVQVSTLLETIRKAVKCQTIKRQKRAYLIKKGIAQGVPLSAALCNLYLSHLDRRHLAEFRSDPNDTLIRAVDDYLFVTPNESKARAFLDRMTAGFEDYGLRISKAKSQSNLLGHEEIIYYGYSINCQTLEVFVKYCDGDAVPFRNSMTFTNKVHPKELLNDKMSRIPTYKLNQLTTDRRYMSTEGLAWNIFNTACMMGCCFKAIVDAKRVPADENHLIEEIDRAANKISLKIKKLTSSSENHDSSFGRSEIRWIVIRAFRLCLSHGQPRDNNPFPEFLLPRLENMEQIMWAKVPFSFKDNLIRQCILDLPPQFRTGH